MYFRAEHPETSRLLQQNLGVSQQWTRLTTCYEYTGVYLAIRKNKVMSFAGKWIQLKIITLSK